ncbi:MAG: hypothetical protein H7Y20_04600, partial [Bryobacteraceae bacterium]|nr:hypothetical protein [Bryobacteraceae bacterium]
GIVGRALRRSLLAGETGVTREALSEAISGFLPSTEGLEKELQEWAAVLECTDREFLPPEIIGKLEGLGGRTKLQERLSALRRMVE